MIVVNGRKFGGLPTACKAYGLDVSLVKEMLNNGILISEIFKVTPENKEKVEKHEKFEGVEIIVHGKEFFSYKDVAAHYGIPLVALGDGLREGHTLEKVVEFYLEKVEASKFTINGKKFPSKNSACKYFSVSPEAVNDVMKKKGLSLEDAINYVIANKKTIVAFGKSFSSYTELANCYGVSSSYIGKLVNNGFSIEGALNEILSFRESRKVLIRDIEFETKKEACAYFGISYGYISLVAKEKGISFEEAIGVWVNQEPVVFGHSFTSLSEACKYFDKKPSAVYRRLIEGFTLDEAFSDNQFPIWFAKERELLGRLFSSVFAMCDFFGINVETYYRRKKRGFCDEEALGIIGWFSDASKSLSINPYFDNAEFHKKWSLYEVYRLGRKFELTLIRISGYCDSKSLNNNFAYRLHMQKRDLVVSYYNDMYSGGTTIYVSDNDELLYYCSILLKNIEKNAGVPVKEIYWFSNSKFKVVKTINVGDEYLWVVK